jgi:hypothetical protein
MSLDTFLASLPQARQDLERRLMALRSLVQGVAGGYYTGLYLYGRPGTGKSHSVLNTLRAKTALAKSHAGHITALGLFDLIDEYREGGVIVLDDVAEIFRSKVALQILLAALGKRPESEGDGGAGRRERVVTYTRRGSKQQINYSGGLIAISNLELHHNDLLDAIRSRVDAVCYDPSDQETAALMLDIASKGYAWGKLSLSSRECHEVTLFLIQESLRMECRLDLRVLIDKSFPKYLQWREGDSESHWRDLVRISLEEELRKTLEPSQAVSGVLERRLVSEREVARETRARYADRERQLVEWRSRTGRSDRAYYRRLAETPDGTP